jgi:hypothetical protein
MGALLVSEECLNCPLIGVRGDVRLKLAKDFWNRLNPEHIDSKSVIPSCLFADIGPHVQDARNVPKKSVGVSSKVGEPSPKNASE